MRGRVRLAALALLLAGPLAAQPAGDVVGRVLEGAERQVGVTVVYDGSYRRLAWPGGDVPNLVAFFARHGEVLPVSREAADYRPGEIVTWRLASGLPHVGIVSARLAGGRPLVIHNVGAGTVLEDVLFANPVTGRYRYPPNAAPPRSSAPRP